MTKADQTLTDIIKDGQSGKYKSFVRSYAGRIRQMMELKNPLTGHIIVSDIDNVLEIISPDLNAEIDWFNTLQSAVKLWCNEKQIANRLLGLKNDNEYDMRVFEKVVMQKFCLSDKPNRDTIVQTNFETLVEMVELGARRFRH